MGTLNKKPYEISIWEDELVTEGTSQYYKEVKIATIGSNVMDSPIRAFEPLFLKNVNGSSTLTFTLYSRYFDEEQGDYVNNPFTKLLVNERKIKLFYDNEWHDFLIKGIEENSKNKTYVYTAKSLHINELSKIGFNIELDTELRNNQGTVHELAEEIFKDTDWEVVDSGEKFQELIEEPLYEVTLNKNIVAYDMEDETNTLSIAAGEKVYTFYSTISEKDEYFQFLYRVEPDPLYDIDNREILRYPLDDDYVIIDTPNYYVKEKVAYVAALPSIGSNSELIHHMRGRKLVRKQKTVFDTVLNRLVNVYTKDGKEYHGYSRLTILDSRLANNIITNGDTFTSLNGWTPSISATVDNQIYPKVTVNTDFTRTFTRMLVAKFDSTGALLYNNGISKNLSFVKNIAAGEKYVFNIRHGSGNDTSLTQPSNTKGLRAMIAGYGIVNDQYIVDNNKIYFNFNTNFGDLSLKNGYRFKEQYIIAEAQASLSYEELSKERIGIFLYNPDAATTSEYYIESVEIFPFFEDTTGGGRPFIHYTDLSYLVPTIDTYYYYDPKQEDLIKEEDIVYIYKGGELSPDFEPVYLDDYEKVRSIKASESNVFNLSQELCEIFECWIKYDIQHEENGSIRLIELPDGSKRQDKSISFHKYTFQEKNYRGFKYGINLDSIARNLDSDALVSKLIVKPNSNEFGENGFCTISRASSNPTKQNALYDFKYYINQQLLKVDDVSRDFYVDDGTSLGFYTQLTNINLELNELIQTLSNLAIYQANEKATYQSLYLIVSEAENESLRLKNDLRLYTGYSYDTIKSSSSSSAARQTLNNEAVREMMVSIQELDETIRKTSPPMIVAQNNLEGIEARIKGIQSELKSLDEQTRALNKKFYQKYSAYIQEGVWTSEDYIDDNLYYLDALNVLNTSVMPQVTYTINVLEISQVEGYENYIFELGDKTDIEDTEFFGWVNHLDGSKTPYKEEIIISEVQYSLDSPEKNKVVVQNYKTQFEDLFQRIAAATQSVQYAQGGYNRAANMFNPNGTIRADVLENSFANNSIILANASDQSVAWDETGITISNLFKPNEIVRLVSGGIFLTDDGGTKWTAGVTPKGINTNYLTAGQIDVYKIQIMSGEHPTFRWDSLGINAYEMLRDQFGNLAPPNYNNFVRFDQYGIYGVKGGSGDFIPNNEQDVINNSKFSLTWSGFRLKSDDNLGGYLSISSDKDLEIYRESALPGGNPRLALQLGRLGGDSAGFFGLELFGGGAIKPSFSAKDDGSIFIGGENEYLKWENGELSITGKVTGAITMGEGSSISWNYVTDKPYIPAGYSDTQARNALAAVGYQTTINAMSVTAPFIVGGRLIAQSVNNQKVDIADGEMIIYSGSTRIGSVSSGRTPMIGYTDTSFGMYISGGSQWKVGASDWSGGGYTSGTSTSSYGNILGTSQSGSNRRFNVNTLTYFYNDVTVQSGKILYLGGTNVGSKLTSLESSITALAARVTALEKK